MSALRSLERVERDFLDWEATQKEGPEDRDDMAPEELQARGLLECEEIIGGIRFSPNGTIFAIRLG